MTPFKNEAQWTDKNFSPFIICEYGILNMLVYVSGGKNLNYKLILLKSAMLLQLYCTYMPLQCNTLPININEKLHSLYSSTDIPAYDDKMKKEDKKHGWLICGNACNILVAQIAWKESSWYIHIQTGG